MRLFASVFFLFVALSSMRASDAEYNRQSLHGLRDIEIAVEDLNAEAAKVGLTQQDLQTDVELRLRQSGVRVGPNPTAYLSLRAIVMRSSNVYAIRLSLELNQVVRLVRDPKIVVTADTWSVSGLLMVSPTRARNGVREHVREMVDQFLNAYLEQNPKQ
jgi:hypothetical protein